MSVALQTYIDTEVPFIDQLNKKHYALYSHMIPTNRANAGDGSYGGGVHQ